MRSAPTRSRESRGRAWFRLSRWLSAIVVPGSVYYFLAGFTMSLVYATTIPLLPTLRDSFNLDNQDIALMGFATGLGMVATNTPIGYVIRRYGSRRALISGLAPTVASAFVMAAAVSFWQLLLGSALLGIGFACLLTTNMGALSEMADRKRLGTTMGTLNGIMTFGHLVGPVVSGLIAGSFGWRESYAVSGAIALIVLLTGLLRYRSIAAVGIELKRQVEEAAPTLSGRRRLGEAIFGGLARPLLLVFFLYFVVIYSRSAIGQFLFPIVGQDEVGLSVEAVGALLSLGTLITMVTVVPVGVLADRFGARPMLLFGSLALVGCELLLLVAPTELGFTLSMVLFGLASTCVSLTYTLFGVISRERELRRSLGSFRFFGDFGIVAGPVSMGVLIDRFGFDGGLIFALAVALISVAAIAWSMQSLSIRRRSLRPGKIL